jgi:hypothetical protein
VFSRVSFEKAACIVNGFLEHQSNCSIPSLSYQAGLTAVTKMQGQDFPGLCLLTILSMGGMMRLQYVELERDLTLLLWLGISMNDSLSQKVYTANCLSTLSEQTVWFLTVTKALIGDQREYSLSAGLQLVKLHGLVHYVDQIKKFGSPLRYFGGWLFGIILEGQAQETNQENQWSPARSAT